MCITKNIPIFKFPLSFHYCFFNTHTHTHTYIYIYIYIYIYTDIRSITHKHVHP